MIVFGHVFLILSLVPRLLYGAPTDPYDPNLFAGLSQSFSSGHLPLSPGYPPSLPPLHQVVPGYGLPPQTGPHTNLGQPANANPPHQQPESASPNRFTGLSKSSASGHLPLPPGYPPNRFMGPSKSFASGRLHQMPVPGPHTNLGPATNANEPPRQPPKSMSAGDRNTCVLPQGTRARTLSTPFFRPLQETNRGVFTARIAITKRGVVVYIPLGANVIISPDPDSDVVVPPDQTRIRILQQDDNLVQTICVLPEGTKYRRLGRHGTSTYADLETTFRIRSDRIAVTRRGVMIFLPRGTIVIKTDVPDHIVLPTGDTKIKTLEMDDPRVQAICVLPEGIEYHKPQSKESHILETTFTLPTHWIAVTPKDVWVYLPKHASVVVFGHDVIVPSGADTDIKISNEKLKF